MAFLQFRNMRLAGLAVEGVKFHFGTDGSGYDAIIIPDFIEVKEPIGDSSWA